MTEHNLFSDKNVTITTERVIINRKTYALRNIISVEPTYTPAKRGCAIILLFIGLFFILAAFSTASLDAYTIIGGLIFAVPIIGIAILKLRKSSYHVTITTTAGMIHALTSRNRKYIEKIVAHISNAIVEQ